MVDSPDFIPRILVLGSPPAVWPEPLATWVELEQVLIVAVPTIYDAAVAIRSAQVLLINPLSVRRRDLERLAFFDRLGVPRFFLSASPENASRYRIGRWEDACRFFEHSPAAQTQRERVTDGSGDPYDGLEKVAGPLLSDEEMRALLGATESLSEAP